MGSSTEGECASAGWKHGMELDVATGRYLSLLHVEIGR